MTFMNGRSQAVRIPAALRLDTKEVEVTPHGDGLLITPKKPESWPTSFFEEITITDNSFARPEQEEVPKVDALDL